MTEVMKNESGIKTEVKDSLGVTTVAMTIHATIPKLIPILFKEKDQVVGDAILFAIEKTRDETGEPNTSFVILHNDSFETEEIFSSIKTNKNYCKDDELFKYPPKQEDECPSIDYLDDLMENMTPGFLVLKDKTFKGSEAMNLILIMSDGGGSISDLRCNMLRCISNVSIIHVIDEYERLKFDKVRQFDNLMKCMNECENFIYQCQTCFKEQADECGEQKKKNILICHSCKNRKACHSIDHDFTRIAVKRQLKMEQVKCGCDCNK